MYEAAEYASDKPDNDEEHASARFQVVVLVGLVFAGWAVLIALVVGFYSLVTSIF